MAVEIKKGAFGRPIQTEKTTLNKQEKGIKRGFFVYKLINEETLSKPVDQKTGEPVGEPYPALYIAPNAGVAVNPASGETERWRYLFGYNSIWEKDQQNPAPNQQRLQNFDGKNDLIFRTGKIKIMAKDEAKIQALEVQDIFDGIGDRQIMPLPFKYTLVDPAREESNIRNAADEAFEAESIARKSSTDEMYAVAMAFGIDIQNADMDEDSIKTKFILKAKQDPKLFMKVFNDPRNRIKYFVTKALSDGGLIAKEGVLYFNGAPTVGVRHDQDVAEQVAKMVIDDNEKAKQLYDTLKSLG